MNVLLTSCGLETAEIERVFKEMLTKSPEEIKALFITTAAVSAEAVAVLPKCLADLEKCGIRNENIRVYDLHDPIEGGLYGVYDVVYLCGGNPGYLMRRINEGTFRGQLLDFIEAGGIVVGVSAGSMIFADDMEGNLRLLCCRLDVHFGDDECEKAGSYDINRKERIKLGDRQGIIFKDDKMIIFG
ncbi:MAG: Type 1 glutamine amidotransferase-like domain-containing protein [Oscillospiraceae bacterium]|nr:Type 1 glutamine amidotransferase-like domain-containing protein [Oscillospiraceae bacterium]